MMDLHKQNQGDPPQKEINFVLNIFNLNKKNLQIKKKYSLILFIFCIKLMIS